jgi:hypothetical protein
MNEKTAEEKAAAAKAAEATEKSEAAAERDAAKKKAEEKAEFTPLEIQEKTNAGLTKDQAIEALRNQREHDKTKPHDLPPDTSKKLEKPSKK